MGYPERRIKLFSLHLACFLAALFMFDTSVSKAESVRVGYYDWPPHVMTLDGKSDGAALRHFSLIAAELGWEIESVREYPINRLMNKLAEGTIDVGLFFARTPERASRFSYPKAPFYIANFAVAVPSSHPVEGLFYADKLHGLKVGYLKGAYRSRSLRDKRIEYEYLFGKDWAARNISRLNEGLLGAVLGDPLSLDFEVRRLELSPFIRVYRMKDEPVPIYSAMSNEFAADNLAEYEQALARVLAKHSYEDVYEEYVQEVMAREQRPH